MNYAQTTDGLISVYPYTMAMLKAANPLVGFPRKAFASAEIRQEYRVVEVATTDAPISDTHNVEEIRPILVDGVWTQAWEQTPKSAEELDAQAIEQRVKEYGLIASQIEFITENGLTSWQTKVAAIKAKYPKS